MTDLRSFRIGRAYRFHNPSWALHGVTVRVAHNAHRTYVVVVACSGSMRSRDKVLYALPSELQPLRCLRKEHR